MYAQVRPHDGFADVVPLFTEVLRLLDGVDEDLVSWEAAYDAIRDAVTLRNPDGLEVPEFLLHIDGDHAWWRYNDEPFDEDEWCGPG
mgnify:CR=1 FL=1